MQQEDDSGRIMYETMFSAVECDVVIRHLPVDFIILEPTR